ncbi:ribonuclease domain-containing protein [Virgibacillus pantothenticus]|uniref:ribonuclease domain-containing protein n=1 Tax=Virgibacillus pantothenticus TaxID=1473 RepID=UPI003D168B85
MGGAIGGIGLKSAYRTYRLLKTFKAPKHVKVTMSKIKNGAPPKGYKGGRIYHNKPKKRGHYRLPRKDSYREYDVRPYIKGKNRGKERLVIGSKGRAYYTKNHYKTFKRVR